MSPPRSARADIHALGAILYEALTGRPPFRAESPELLYHQLVHSDVVPPSRIQPGVPRDLEAICLKCLEKSPASATPRRSSSPKISDDSSAATRSTPGRRALRRSLKSARRHPWQTIAAATAVIAALAFIGMTYRYHLELTAEIRRTRDQAVLARLNYQQAQSTIQAMLARLDDRRSAGSPRLLELRHDQQESPWNSMIESSANRVNDPMIRRHGPHHSSETSVLQLGSAKAPRPRKGRGERCG